MSPLFSHLVQNKGKNKNKTAEETKQPPTVVAPAVELPVEELLKLAQEQLDALNITEAQNLYERALLKYPDNPNVLDAFAELLFSLGESERGIQVPLTHHPFPLLATKEIGGTGT
jgi:hypothetical protein